MAILTPKARLVKERTEKPAAKRDNPWTVEALGKNGSRACLHGVGKLAIYVLADSYKKGIGKKLLDLGGKVWQRGDEEIVFVFPYGENLKKALRLLAIPTNDMDEEIRPLPPLPE